MELLSLKVATARRRRSNEKREERVLLLLLYRGVSSVGTSKTR
jgi:hypothetical protein